MPGRWCRRRKRRATKNVRRWAQHLEAMCMNVAEETMAEGVASPVRDISGRTMEIRQVDVYGSTIRVAIWPGDREKTPLLMFNGIGASPQLLGPFADALGAIEPLALGARGTAQSSLRLLPFRLWMLAMLASPLLGKLGYDKVDVL